MKKLMLLLFIGLGLCSDELLAQQYNTLLNTGSAANLVPFSSTATRRLLTLYRPSDFLTMPPTGAINRIYLASASGSGSGTWSNFVVRMGQTTDTVLSSTTFPALSVHRTGNLVVNSVTANAYIPINLTTPFPFDSTQSLLVEISYEERTAGTGFSVRANTLTGLNIALGAATNSSGTGAYSAAQRTIGLDFVSLPALDAGITAVQSPSAPYFAGSPNPVSVQVTNLGTQNITSLTLNYQFGNRSVVSETFPTNQASFGVAGYTFTNPLTFPMAGDSTLRIWVSQVNGAPDANSSNDTISRFICLPLAGPVYSVGTASSDFPTIQAAIDRLNCSGVAANVTFNIAPGSYFGNYTLNDLPGSGFNITFQSAGQAGDVKLYPGTSAAALNQPVFTVANESGVIFQQLTFVRNTLPTAATPLLLLSNGLLQSVSQVVFVDSTNSNSVNNQALVAENQGQLQLVNSQFLGFGRAFLLTDTDTIPSDNNSILHNQFVNYAGPAVQISNQSGLTLSNNRFSNFTGLANADAGLIVQNVRGSTIAANRWSGILPRISGNFSNLNGDINGPNLIYNNEVSGQTSNNGSTANITTGFSITGNTAQGNDRVIIAHNSFYFRARSTSSSNFQGVIYLDGGTTATSPFEQLELRNNVIATFAESTQTPASFALLTVSGQATADTLVSSNNVFFRPGGLDQQAYFRINNPANSFTSLAAWRTATGQDMNSVFVNPFFQADSLLIPFSAGVDNIGTPLAFVATDLLGQPRSLTTPDAGAYEFVGASLASFSFQPLADTTSLTNRSVTIGISDSTGLVTGTNGPRMYYRKAGQATFQSAATPVQSGNNFTFIVNYSSLGSFVQGDTLEYYFAAINTSGTVTTLPLGGSGASPVGSVPPSSLFSYRIVPSASGSYTVGVGGNFTTITAAAAFINSASFSGDATFVLIDTAYAQENFPLVFTNNLSRAANRRAIIRPNNGVNVRISTSFSAAAPAMWQFEDARHIEINGSWTTDTLQHLHLQAANGIANSAIVWFKGSDGVGNDSIILKNIRFQGTNDENLAHYAIYGGANSISNTGLGSNNNLTIESNRFVQMAQAIYFRGLTNDPATGLRIRNNVFGDDNLLLGLKFRGIELHTTTDALIEGNRIRNVVTAVTTLSPAAIDIQGSHTGLRILKNEIREVRHNGTSGLTQGAYGININGGTGVMIANNVIVDMTTSNRGNSATTQATGIRLQAGTGHRLYYNTVHLNGVHPQTTGAAATAALHIVATAVSGLDVKNNIFANTMSTPSTSTGIYFVAVWFAQNYSFATNTFDNNAYFVADSSQNLVARFGTLLSQVFCPTLDDFLPVSRVGNAANNTNSIPLGAKVPPTFLSATDVRPNPAVPSLLESGGIFISQLDSPNTDIAGLERPAFGGSAPDMGAYEFAGIRAGDLQAPQFDSLNISLGLNQCTPTARTVDVWVSDASRIDSVILYRAVNGGSRVPQNMTFIAGRADSGLWRATVAPALAGDKIHLYLRAVDSIGQSTPVWRIATLQDGALAFAAPQRDTVLTPGSPLPRAAATTAGGLVISEVFFSRLSNGSQTTYPNGFPTDLTMTAFEITNTSKTGRSLNGLQLRIVGLVEFTYNLPNITLDSGQVLTLVGGSGTNNPTERLYFMNSPSRTIFQSSAAAGYYIFDPLTEEVIDAASQMGYNFGTYSPVGKYDWVGNITTGGASVQLEGLDSNNPTPWRFATTSFFSTIGSRNDNLIVGPGNYSWINLANAVVVATGPEVQFVPPASGNYAVVYTFNGCTLSDTFNVALNAPDLAVTAILNPLAGATISTSAPITVRARVKNNGNQQVNGPFTVNYRVNNGSTFPTAVSNSLPAGDSLEVLLVPAWELTTGGPQQLCVFVNAISNDNNAANDTLCISLNSTVSVENNYLSQLRVYPNPASSSLTIDGIMADKGIDIQLFDLQGRQLLSAQPLGENQTTLDISQLPTGNYLLRLRRSDAVRNERISIIR
mgnify:CR=1 FL=1